MGRRCWPLKLLLIASAVVLGLSADVARGQLMISPAYVEVKLDRGRPSGRFLVSNIGKTTERYRVQAIHFTYSLHGGLRQSKTGKHSMAPWIIFNPKELTIAPKTQRAVRFVIVPRGKLSKGEYWTAMELESLKQIEKTSKDKEGRIVTLKFVATIMVPIFGQVGQVTYHGSIEKAAMFSDPKGNTLVSALIVNSGTGRLGTKGTYKIIDSAAKTVREGELGSGYILRDSKRWFTVSVKGKLPAGRYTLRTKYIAAHLKKPLMRETQIDWIPPKPKPTSSPGSTRPAPTSKPVDGATTKPQS